MRPVLCGYCPRRIVAREGQHVAKGAKALGKVVPLRTILISICGIFGNRERSASSVRMNRMFGISPVFPSEAPPAPAGQLPGAPGARTKEKHRHWHEFVCARGLRQEESEK